MDSVTQEPLDSKFDGASTAEDVIAGLCLGGKLAVVTGGSTGLGKETARALAKAGADVFLGARNEGALEGAKRDLLAGQARSAYTRRLDLMDPASVDSFANAVLELGRPVDILVNNAGIMACPLARNVLGIESQFAANFLGHAQLTNLLAPALLRAGESRLISLSSAAHQFSSVNFDDPNFDLRPYDKWAAYGQSKTADVLLAVKIAASLGSKGVTALAVHPGMIVTDLGRHLEPEDVEQTSARLGGKNVPADDIKDIPRGAATSVWAATASILSGRGPLYLEDCQVAPLIEQPEYLFGVMRYALDRESAERLWRTAERMLGRTLHL